MSKNEVMQSHFDVEMLKILFFVALHVKQPFSAPDVQVRHLKLQLLQINVDESWYCPGEQMQLDPFKTVKWVILHERQFIELN